MSERSETDTDRCAICVRGTHCPSEVYAECTTGVLDHYEARVPLREDLERARKAMRERRGIMRPPRFDDVFERGTAMLDAMARGEEAPPAPLPRAESPGAEAGGTSEPAGAIVAPEREERLVRRVAELEARLVDMGRVQTETLDRLHEVERQRDALDLRLRRALERQAKGHTAEAYGYVAIPRDVAEQVAAAVAACEPYQRGAGLDTTREP